MPVYPPIAQLHSTASQLFRASHLRSASAFWLQHDDERCSKSNWCVQLVGLGRGWAAGVNNCIEWSICEYELVIASPALLGYFFFDARLRTNRRVLVQKGTGIAICDDKLVLGGLSQGQNSL